jgi:hypothetical protein
MNMTPDALARDKFYERIRNGLLGPGSDIFVSQNDLQAEIISDYPLQRYYTGILFPEKDRVNSQNEEDEAVIESETPFDQEEAEEVTIKDNKEIGNVSESDSTSELFKEKAGDEDIVISPNNFFPTNIGLTFCVDKNVKEIEVEFSFGLYYQPSQKEIKIEITPEGFNAFTNDKSIFPLKDILKYENGYMFLARELKGYKGGRGKERSEEYKLFDTFKRSGELENHPLLKNNLYLFEQLIGRTWKRKQIIKDLLIKIPESYNKDEIYSEQIDKDNQIRVGYYIKKYNIGEYSYIKIQLVNNSDKHPSRKFSNKNERLNRKCLFQSRIKVKSKNFQPYKSYQELHPYDEEARILKHLYDDVYSYGIGHNCSVIWDENNKKPQWIETTFLPSYDVNDIKNTLTPNAKNLKENIINESLDIYNLTVFGLSKNEVINKISGFINSYGEWITNQKEKIKSHGPIETHIINKLDDNYMRLKHNVALLKDDNIFKAFQLANTAMYIQIILSYDPDFNGREKMLSELNADITYDDIIFFRNYDFRRLQFGRPMYRPFQLAFLLLCLDSIIDVESKDRNEIVDLLWFPTGGGKTEAYLVVAAFTIVWRRFSNDIGYEGTSVIMRYTLRLLTAQQFERASRLIVALEFLRNKYPEVLKDEKITIGLWVGMASTPNKVKDAHKIVDEINAECNKGDKGNPEQKNTFQVSSCPWCGSKLINKNKHNKWDQGFEIVGRGQNAKFKIKCLNERCFYHKELPMQVVDEMLYENPPTLLFATVDKFAILAWEENGHRFFNSLSDNGLPPDLIIQDELHLLSGPLGSITGIFESIVEVLCTKDGRKPKIIASTATTRNTREQIKALYGGREVNAFPPSGLNYKDNFFAKIVEEDSKRQYVGFMPTGKTAIDSQLQLIAHLLVARMEVYREFVKRNSYEIIDNYWTIVSYYNSLKDVGKIYNKIGDEISNFTSTLQIKLLGENPAYTFNYYGLPNRVVELTSRIESPRIKQVLKELEENKFQPDSVKKYETEKTYLRNIVDLALATNMISVGIDIERLNLMLINGQPKNIAEYIQASSRVGRKNKGLVIALLDANRARDKSYLEHFVSFHQAFYKSIEPISITPFTENTVDKMLSSLIITYIRHKKGLFQNNNAQYFLPEMLNEFKKMIIDRFKDCKAEYLYFESKIDDLAKDWIRKIKEYSLKNYKVNIYRKEAGLMKRPTEKASNEDEKWSVMESMREIDTSSFIQILLQRRNV